MVSITKDVAVREGWNEDVQLNSNEDVATLLDVYEKCISENNPSDVAGIAEKDGYFICIIDPSVVNDFDFFMWLNSKYAYEGRTNVNCANARFLFPRELSRGEYIERSADTAGSDTGDFEDSSDETATGFWDDGEDEEEVSHYVRHVALGEDIIIDDEDGVIFGRSTSRSGYSVDNDLMSRLHARVYMDGDKYMVEDLGSRNGTYINNVKVFPGKDKEIRPGNTLRMANEEFKFI